MSFVGAFNRNSPLVSGPALIELRRATRLADARAALSVAEVSLDALTVRVAGGAIRLVRGQDDLVTVTDAVRAVFAARAAIDELRFELLGVEPDRLNPNDEDDVASALMGMIRASEQGLPDLTTHDAATYRSQVQG
ncbi:hypothetical protein [Methylobacterium aquaticum]|uniref:Uncharacterized protein n=1 Tax=Methylobacterium aquaticum TaxID=270351 RepID=A0A0C6EWG1_9HYPH|nr:hypothetical protein [Methylobacterium aquaticum]BAQ44366.1 hypothetical protein Maq22A_c04800 [Methylobacterium aquaticum]